MGPQGQVTLLPIVETGPKSNIRDFMPVLVICKFDEDSIKNEVVIVWTTFSPLLCLWETKGQVTLM